MKKILCFLLLALLCTAGNAWADAGDQYLLPKLGIMSIDLKDADPLYSAGVLYGYGITSDVTVEGELNLGLTGGEYSETPDSGKYKIWTLAGYAVYRYRTTAETYLKGKLGVLYENVERASDLPDQSDTATGFGLAGGLGAGFIIGEALTLEAEMTVIDKDIIFYSLGIHYPF